MSGKRPGWRSAERTYKHLTNDLKRKARESVVSECLDAMVQAQAALPDAWLAVKCDVPREVVEKLDATIKTARQFLGRRP